jgi:hypothetical protein
MGGMTMLKQQKKARKTCHARLQQVKQVNEASATTLTGRKKCLDESGQLSLPELMVYV